MLVAAGLAGGRDHALISLLALNGLRVSEAIGADVEDLGLERGHRTLTIVRKGGKVVTVPLAPRTARAIDLAVGERCDGPIFVGTDSRRIDRHAAGRIVRRIARRAGIAKRVGPHTLRVRFVLVPHMVVRMMTHGALDQLRHLCADDDLAFGLLADLPGLVATEPSLALHRLAEGARMTGQVDEDALDAFIARYGYRGVNELDPTVPVWDQQRQGLLAMIEQLAAGASSDPAGRAQHVHAQARRKLGQAPLVRRWRIRAAARPTRTLQLLGEPSKDDIVRYVHEIRLALRQLVDHLSARIDPVDAVLLSWGELCSLAVDGEPLTVDLAERRRELARCTTDQLLDQSDGDRGESLQGVAASPGHGTGRAVVVDDPLVATEEGDVLVAHAADTAWTPLFLGKSAVVTDVGGVISHASIVARDLGIPAVVDTQTATTLISTGDHTDVDGDRGLVTVRR
jgi:phosphohistidine swiveling domain-containing protein